MSYNGVGGLEDPQNTESTNNWPFSVRYTASPYRKAKFAPSTLSPTLEREGGPPLPPHLPSSSLGGLGVNHTWGLAPPPTTSPSTPHHHLLHNHNAQEKPYQNPPFIPPHLNEYHNHPNHFNKPGNLNNPNLNRNTNSGNLQKYLIQQQEAHFAQQLQLNNPLAYQNHFVALKQHQQQQQQLLQQRQRQYDHHHYGLPLMAMPHALIFHAPTPNPAANNKGFLHQQAKLEPGVTSGAAPPRPGSPSDNPHFQMRYPSHFNRNRLFHLNESNHIDQVEGLDEGYIEDVKEPPAQPLHSIRSGSVTERGPLSQGGPYNPLTKGDSPYPTKTGSSSGPGTDPNYSYVYDSHLMTEDLTVCTASLNQVFLQKGPSYPNKPYPYSPTTSSLISATENEYEEIRDVQRYMNSSYGKVLNNLKDQESIIESPEGDMGPCAPKHFKSFSTSTDDILAQVVQVREKHDRVLDQLNIEVENLLLNSSKEIAKETDLKMSSPDCPCPDCIKKTSTMPSVNGFKYGSCEPLCSSGCSCGRMGDELRAKTPSLSKGEGGGEVVIGGNRGDGKLGYAPCGIGGGTFGRKGKLVEGTCFVGDSNCGTCCGGRSGKNKHFRNHLKSLQDANGKGRSQRTYSFIPNWKIRDHLLRLPFLKHHHDKLKKGSGVRSFEFDEGGGGNKDKMATLTDSSPPPPPLPKTRSSSMDELRSGEEHWYSADSDTEPDSLTIPPEIPEDPSSKDRIFSTKQLDNDPFATTTTINNCGSKAPGNLYSNCGQHHNGFFIKKMDIGNVMHEGKAPKFRRGSGIKEKWRDSWSSHSKTLLKSSPMEEAGLLQRMWSLRKNSTLLYGGKEGREILEEDLKRLSFMEEEEGYGPRRIVQPPSLPPPPPHLAPHQLTRRHIIATIVHSENNYVAALQRLVNEYKKPLEASHPAMLSHSKVATIFHRLAEILQCHSLFRIALADYVRRWDSDEKIGDVFVASFSKSLVLDVYSEFINNFGNAMETAKVEARRKSAFAEFLKVKQMTAHDRLSLFGLMVKPVQRFPQFILLLQDLLKHTPKDHHDRMSIQIALTQLESLAAMLNERKRESEQYQAFRETIKSIGGGKFVLLRSIADDPNRILLRQDAVTQLEFEGTGGTVAKSKHRKLLLLNDMLICTTVQGSNSFTSKGDSKISRKESYDEESRRNSRVKSEKSVFKWSFPVGAVEVEDISISPTMSRFVHRSNSLGAGGKSSGPNLTSDDSASLVLLEEMQSLMYDYEVLSRVLNLVSTLKSSYDGLTASTVKELMLEIQHQIRCRDEQISYFDSSCLTLILGAGTNKEKIVFQMQSPEARSGWIEELRLAQLALDPNNSPAWDIPPESPYPHHKLPLFVRALSLSKQQHLTTVKCGCFFTHTFVSKTGRSQILDYLWVSSTDGMSSHMTAYRSQQNTLKEVSAFDLVEEKVNDMVFVRGHIWVATESRKIMMYDPADPDKGNIGYHILSDSVLKLIFYNNAIYAGLGDGNLAVFTELDTPRNLTPEVVLRLGSERIISLFGSREHVYAACGSSVVVVDTKTHTIENNVILTHQKEPISQMTCSGVGLWIATQESETVCLYHLETFQKLQDVSIAPSVFRTVKDSFRRSKGVKVTCLTAHKGWLWIGTNLGVVLTIPLPRLEGVPIISTGNANVSYHGYCGPVTFLMPLIKPAQQAILPLLPSTEKTTTSESVTLNISESTSTKEPDSKEEDVSRRRIVGFSEAETVDSGTTTTETTLTTNTDTANNSTEISDGIISDKTSSCMSIDNSSSSPSSVLNGKGALVVLRKKSSKDNIFLRNCKTLPRGGPIPSHLRFSTDSDVYGLYGNLINVRGLEDEGRFLDPLYDALRRSDPEVNALDAKISTLDRRLRMRMSRPRSLDLSNWSVDSKISASSDESVGLGSRTSQTTTDSLSSPLAEPPTTSNAADSLKINGVQETGLKGSSGTTGRKGQGRSKAKSSKGGGQKRTVLVVVGGRGYLNMRTLSQEHFISNTDSESKSCPHLTLWQMKT